MIYIENPSTDPYENQALEETLFHTAEAEDLFFLWRNEPVVVCGKYQNLFGEVHVPAAHAQNVALIRRVSGGGTVYHDLGNINYSMITSCEPATVEYTQFLQPMIEALRSLGVEAQIVAGNGIGVEGKKISGSAQRMVKRRVLHHGTLLFDTDLTRLRTLANGAAAGDVSRATASNPWPVTNLKPYLPQYETAEAFLSALYDALDARYGFNKRALTEAERKETRMLAETKYRDWDWTFGGGPPFERTRVLQTKDGALPVTLTIKKGIVQEVEAADERFRALSGVRFDPDAIGRMIGDRRLAEQLF